MRIAITDRARTRFLGLGAGGEDFLRLSVVPGGCSGNTYSAAVDSALGPHDKVVYQDGDFRVVADVKSAVYLDGLHVDYSDDLIRAGFRFNNPGAAKSCGCGASFAVLSAGQG